jgi:molybdate transport system regulatory protein
LGPGKIKLLKAIASKKTLAAAAKSLRMSYRLAWKHLRVMEERTGLTVVEPRRGGAEGGGTELTPQGMALLEAYRTFHDEVDQCVQAACRRHFARWSSPTPADHPSEEPAPVNHTDGGGDSVEA